MASSIADQTGVRDLLKSDMGLQFHGFPEEVSPGRLAAVLVGMANGLGGAVVLGVSPRSRYPLGVNDPQAAIDRVFQACLLADPPLVLPLPRVESLEETRLVLVTVPAGLPNVYALDGRYLGREGAQTNPLPARRLRQLLLERGVIQFETQCPALACLDDLDQGLVMEYVNTLDLPGNPSPQEILYRRGCIKQEGGIYRPTYAALLLFAKHPQQWLPGATILAARFSGIGFSDQYIKQEMRGPLPHQIQQAEAFVRDQLRSMVRLDGLTHREQAEYPYAAVRELLVNAVAHRDYNLQGDTIHINIFSDRLEVHSPGALPGPVNLSNLLEARFSRNAVIVQVLADLGFVERLGYGLDRVTAALKEAGLRPPRFEEVAGSFRVTLFAGESMAEPLRPNDQAYPDLNLRQQIVLNFLTRRSRITNSQYQELCPGVHAETLRRDLADLVARGLLIKVGDKRATYYILR